MERQGLIEIFGVSGGLCDGKSQLHNPTTHIARGNCLGIGSWIGINVAMKYLRNLTAERHYL